MIIGCFAVFSWFARNKINLRKIIFSNELNFNVKLIISLQSKKLNTYYVVRKGTCIFWNFNIVVLVKSFIFCPCGIHVYTSLNAMHNHHHSFLVKKCEN
jgi:hypothetical protein